MASNMLKQVIPLLKSQVPLIGTGMEHIIYARNTKGNITTHNDGMVISADSNKVVVYESDLCKHRVYIPLIITKSNQEMCQRVRTFVNPGQMLRSGKCYSRMSIKLWWRNGFKYQSVGSIYVLKGYNFEDSVILSDGIVTKGIFNSLQIIDLKDNGYEDRTWWWMVEYRYNWDTNEVPMVFGSQRNS